MKGQGNDARGQRQGSRSCRGRNTSFTSTIEISLKPLQLIFGASFEYEHYLRIMFIRLFI